MPTPTPAPTPSPGPGATSGSRLISFDSDSPGTLTGDVAITGLPTGALAVALDRRPSNGMIYLLTQTAARECRLYTLEPASGAATAIGTQPFACAATVRDIDFNPVPDKIRVIADVESYRVDPDTGAIAGMDTPPVFAPGDRNAGQPATVGGVAYDRNDSNAASATTLFGIETSKSLLVRIGDVDGMPDSPNSGNTHTIGELGVTLNPGAIGFDISGEGGAAFISAARQGAPTLYTVDLSSGRATETGRIGCAAAVTQLSSLAVAPDANLPAPAAGSPAASCAGGDSSGGRARFGDSGGALALSLLAALGALGALRRRRRRREA